MQDPMLWPPLVGTTVIMVVVASVALLMATDVPMVIVVEDSVAPTTITHQFQYIFIAARMPVL
jgi:hypothetical protein